MRERKRYFLQQFGDHEFFHGGVGCADAEHILEEDGFEPILFPARTDFSFFAKWKRFVYLLRIFLFLKRGSVVVFLFPAYARMEKMLLYLLGFRKSITVICFIADINGLKDGNKELLVKEVKELKRYKYFIVHGQPMQEWLQTITPGCKVSQIEFFDFLADPYYDERELSDAIVFAGNLEKSKFLEQLYLLQEKAPAVRFHLYGPGQTDKMKGQPNVSWYGVRKPSQLPLFLEGSFGLVWDGDSVNHPGGSLGEYMKYISHHKLSLYILSRLPVIVPATGASAYLVEKYKIGILTNDLNEIEEKIRNISAEQYQNMQKNMDQLSRRISTGGNLKAALEKLLK